MCYYGNQAFSWTELYNMPIWLRKQYYRMLVEAKEKEKAEHEEAAKQQKLNSKRKK